MKKLFVLFLAIVMCLSLVACGQSDTEIKSSESENKEHSAESKKTVIVSEEPEKAKPNYAEILPDKLQGVWCDTSVENLLSFYAFDGENIKTYVVNIGLGASSGMFGTYSIEDGKIIYDYENFEFDGYSKFTYEDNILVLSNANDAEIKKVSSAEIMEYLIQEEDSSNKTGIVCLADLILNYYADSPESKVASEKKEEIAAIIKKAGEDALENLTTDYDKVQKLTWYKHKNQPEYTDITCYIYPYIGQMDSGELWLRVQLNYTDAQTDAGWIFFEKVIFSVDGENTIKEFRRNDIVRDNDSDVWEVADYGPSDSDIKVLKSIADSTETIIRFQGDEYHADHIVTNKEKAAIKDVLTAYDYLKNNHNNSN